jgi:hypothetical protein
MSTEPDLVLGQSEQFPGVERFLREFSAANKPVPEVLLGFDDENETALLQAIRSDAGQSSPWSAEWIDSPAQRSANRFLSAVAEGNMDLSNVDQLPTVAMPAEQVDPASSFGSGVPAAANGALRVRSDTGVFPEQLGLSTVDPVMQVDPIAREKGPSRLRWLAAGLAIAAALPIVVSVNRRYFADQKQIVVTAMRGGSSAEPLASEGPTPLATQKPLVFTLAPEVCEVGVCTESNPIRATSAGFTPKRSVEIEVQLPDGREANTAGAEYSYRRFSPVDEAGGFPWTWWVGSQAIEGIYRVTITDVATGRLLSSTFRVVSGSGTSPKSGLSRMGIRTNDTTVVIGSDGVPYLAAQRISVSVNDRPSHHLSAAIVKVQGNVDLIATCQTKGQMIGNGNGKAPAAAALSYSSDIWYGVEVDGKFGYIADTWTTRTNGLGLPNCGVPGSDAPAVDAAEILNPTIRTSTSTSPAVAP